MTFVFALQVAEAICLTVAKSFDMAFELWQKAHRQVTEEQHSDDDDDEINTNLVEQSPERTKGVYGQLRKRRLACRPHT